MKTWAYAYFERLHNKQEKSNYLIVFRSVLVFSNFNLYFESINKRRNKLKQNSTKKNTALRNTFNILFICSSVKFFYYYYYYIGCESNKTQAIIGGLKNKGKRWITYVRIFSVFLDFVFKISWFLLDFENHKI